MQVNITDAGEQLARLVDRAIEGEEITLAKDGVPAVRLVPVQSAKRERKLGMYRDQISIGDDFNAPLSDEILAGFLGEDVPSENKEPDVPTKAVKRPLGIDRGSVRMAEDFDAPLSIVPEQHTSKERRKKP